MRSFLFKPVGNSVEHVYAHFNGIPEDQIVCIIGGSVEYINPNIFSYNRSWDTVRFKNFVFEDPYGWYCYSRSSNGSIIDCSKVDDTNIKFNQDLSYGKKERQV